MNYTEWIGYAAASLTTASFVPQAWLTFRTRDVQGISLVMYSAFTLGIALWLAYGLLITSYGIYELATGQLADVALKELHAPVIALSQLSRAVEQRGGKPRLSDLRDSGSIEQDADVVMFIHRPNFFKTKDEVTEEERAQTDLIIAKQRNGPVDRIPFVFLGKFTRFEEAATGSWNSDE